MSQQEKLIIIGLILVYSVFKFLLWNFKIKKRYTITELQRDGWKFYRNIYGDEINQVDARSEWTKGAEFRYSNQLYEE